MDETSIKVQGEWRSLERAVDQHGQTLDCLLTEHRDNEAALRLLKHAIRRHGVAEQMTIDGSEANAAAIKRYNAAHGTTMVIRQVQYCDTVVEQDHRAVKRLTRPMLGFQSFAVELMHMIKKRQMIVEESHVGHTTAEQFYALAASSPHRRWLLTPHRLHVRNCDKARQCGARVP
jgi:putative transposase